jgi:hypothetical protein
VSKESQLPEPGSPQVSALMQRCRQVNTAAWSDALHQMSTKAWCLGCQCAVVQGAAPVLRQQYGAKLVPSAGSNCMSSASTGWSLRQDRRRSWLWPPGARWCRPWHTSWRCPLSRKLLRTYLTDAAADTIDDISRGGHWVASRRVTPRTSKLLADHPVAADDQLVGGSTGLAVVPSHAIWHVLARVEKVLQPDTLLDSVVDFRQTLGNVPKAQKAGP